MLFPLDYRFFSAGGSDRADARDLCNSAFLLPVLTPSGSVTTVNFALYSNIGVSVHQFHQLFQELERLGIPSVARIYDGGDIRAETLFDSPISCYYYPPCSLDPLGRRLHGAIEAPKAQAVC